MTQPRPLLHLLPEEDALDEPDEDDETDPTLPGDLWFASARDRAAEREIVRRILSFDRASRSTRRAVICVFEW